MMSCFILKENYSLNHLVLIDSVAKENEYNQSKQNMLHSFADILTCRSRKHTAVVSNVNDRILFMGLSLVGHEKGFHEMIMPQKKLSESTSVSLSFLCL